MGDQFDSQDFRRVLGQFPTGVAAVTAFAEGGDPVGMIVGSFTSVSLDPPLVAFLPAKQSSTAPKIVASGRFSVNVLGAHQEPVSRVFTSGGANKFDSIGWSSSASGLPHLDDAIAWIDCTVEDVHDAGDHQIVVGAVDSLGAPGSTLPLLFFQGGYGRFAPLSFAAAGEPDLVEHLRLVDMARPVMEALAAQCQAECLASSAVGDEIVLLAAAGTPSDGRRHSRVGQRLPLMPPMGAALVAWSEKASRSWVERSGVNGDTTRRHAMETALERVRERGCSIATWSDKLRELEATVDDTIRRGMTPEARKVVEAMVASLDDEHEPERVDVPSEFRSITVPVMDGREQVVMQISLRLPPGTRPEEIEGYLQSLKLAAEQVSDAIRGANHGAPR